MEVMDVEPYRLEKEKESRKRRRSEDEVEEISKHRKHHKDKDKDKDKDKHRHHRHHKRKHHHHKKHSSENTIAAGEGGDAMEKEKDFRVVRVSANEEKEEGEIVEEEEVVKPAESEIESGEIPPEELMSMAIDEDFSSAASQLLNRDEQEILKDEFLGFSKRSDNKDFHRSTEDREVHKVSIEKEKNFVFNERSGNHTGKVDTNAAVNKEKNFELDKRCDNHELTSGKVLVDSVMKDGKQYAEDLKDYIVEDGFKHANYHSQFRHKREASSTQEGHSAYGNSGKAQDHEISHHRYHSKDHLNDQRRSQSPLKVADREKNRRGENFESVSEDIEQERQHRHGDPKSPLKYTEIDRLTKQEHLQSPSESERHIGKGVFKSQGTNKDRPSNKDRSKSPDISGDMYSGRCPSTARDRFKDRVTSPSRERYRDRVGSPFHDKYRDTFRSSSQDRHRERVRSPIRDMLIERVKSPSHDRHRDRVRFPCERHRDRVRSPSRERHQDRVRSPSHERHQDRVRSPLGEKNRDRVRSPSRDKNQDTVRSSRERHRDRVKSPSRERHRDRVRSLSRDRHRDRVISPSNDRQQDRVISPSHDRHRDRVISPSRDRQRDRGRSPSRDMLRDRTYGDTRERARDIQELMKRSRSRERELRQTRSSRDHSSRARRSDSRDNSRSGRIDDHYDRHRRYGHERHSDRDRLREKIFERELHLKQQESTDIKEDKENFREEEDQEEYQERVAMQLAEQEEDDVEKIKEESRKRRQAILEKYRQQKQESQMDELGSQDVRREDGSGSSEDNVTEKKTISAQMSFGQPEQLIGLVDNGQDGNDIFIPDPTFSVGKEALKNGVLPAERVLSNGGLGDGSPKSEVEADMFSDDIFGETPARIRKPGRGDGLPVDTSGLHDNWDDAEGYYGYRIGEVLDARYEIIAAHGKGVFSSVVRAKDLKAGKEEPEEVAIKIIRNNETMYKAGQEELVILKKLAGADPEDKRHCVRFLSSFKYRNHLCLVFESLHMNLREVLKKFGRNIGLNLTAVRAYAKQLFIALKHLKNCGVLHCDIKPDNMLVNDSKNVLKLCDFGNAMFAGKNEITPYLVSRFYRAPEIILGLAYDHAMDIWSVGCCLFELYVGKVLFPGPTNNDMLRLHMELKGPFPKKMLRKGSFTDQHFDHDMNFHATEEDPVSKKVVKRLMVNIKPKDIGSFIQSSPGEDLKMLSNFKDLLERIFILDPDKRLTVSQALSHPFITGK